MRSFLRTSTLLVPALGLILLPLAACQSRTETLSGPVAVQGDSGDDSTTDLQAKAERLAHEYLLVDTHVDVPYRLFEKMEDISERTESGDFDYPRAKAGGLDAPFMSIYVPADMQGAEFGGKGGAKAQADLLIDMVEGFAEQHPDKFAVATSPDEVEQVFAEGKIALPMGMENGAPIEGDLDNLRHFHERGIRYITLAHSKVNHLCDSSYDEARKWHGLSPFGEEVVAEMNRLGMMVDISHVSDETFFQVIEKTKAPVIASHSSARHFTPGWERNMSDEMILKLAENGGVIQINFGSAFLNEEARQASTKMWDARGEFREANGIESNDDPRVEEWTKAYKAENPPVFADVSDVVAHIDHVVELVGIDHVGIGSDYDGVGDSLPTGLKDVSQYPNLVRALLEKGYTDEQIEKILGGNLMRVWREVERVATELSGDAASD